MTTLAFNISEPGNIIITLGGAIITTLSGVVLHLWNSLTTQFKRMEQDLLECEKRHEEANKVISELSYELGVVKGRLLKFEQSATKIKNPIKSTRKR